MSNRHPLGPHLRFLLPSLGGVLLFLTPVPYDGSLTILLGVINDALNQALEPVLGMLLLAVLAVSAVASLVVVLRHRRGRAVPPTLRRLFHVGPGWLLLRVAALGLGLLIAFEAGPSIVHGPDTGRVVYDLALAIITLMAVATLLLPLLTEYGLMDLAGRLLAPLFRRLFTLPGRAAVDAAASWLSAAAVGVLITAQQYERGFYSAREACVIATNFSVVSLPFCLLMANVLGVGERFVEYYLTVVAVGMVSAMLLPRLPPLCNIPDTWATGTGPGNDRSPGGPGQALRAGYTAALARAADAPGPGAYLRTSLVNLLDIWFGLLPGVIVVALGGMILAQHTPLFEWLTLPLVPVLEALSLAEAEAAAPTLLVGFADMFLPAALGQGIDSEATRFVIAGVAVSQLIYMSEVGILLLKLPIPLRLRDMILVFLWRTVIALPLFVLAARLLDVR